MNYFLAAISGSDLVSLTVTVLIVGICVLLVWWVGRWFITKLAAPAIVMTVWSGLFILLGLLVAINFLLSLVGKPLVRF